MGCGKTSVGRVLSARLGCDFIDLDQVVVTEAGASIKEIFATKGEPAFRLLESQALALIAAGPGAVVSTGGGAVIARQNRDIMRHSGCIANLTASVEAIAARLTGDSERPLLQDDASAGRIRTMLDAREKFYADADLRIDTTAKTVEAVAAEIVDALKGSLVTTEIIKVALGERSYDITLGAGILDTVGSLCRELGLSGTAAVVSNTTVAPLYFDRVRASLEAAGYPVFLVSLPDGEGYKNAATLNLIYDALVDASLDRGSFIRALGGGVVGDMAGFAAASYLRGIPFVQLPTTLLSQVDSSVGGKTGINHPRGKNLIGAFYQPRAVLIDVVTLDTLPDREYRSGLGEIVKYGAVLDAEFFSFLEQNAALLLARDKAALIHAVGRSCAIKARVVETDEREGGVRAVLNYGHTLGHAVETLTGYTRYLHGEAVAIGMVQAARISQSYGFCSQADRDRIESLIALLGLPAELPCFPAGEYAQALSHDKKVRDSGLLFICNFGIGGYRMERVKEPATLLEICGIGE